MKGLHFLLVLLATIALMLFCMNTAMPGRRWADAFFEDNLFKIGLMASILACATWRFPTKNPVERWKGS